MERRSFCTASAATAFAAGQSHSPALASRQFPVIDYANSFLHGKSPENQVRFWVESRTRIVDDKTGRHEDFYQCGSCKSEDTFAARNLFYRDNYDFLPVFGPEDGVIFRRKAYLNPGYRELRKASDLWQGQVYRIRSPRSSRLLTTNHAIRAATHEGLPVVAQTEISDPATGLRAILEFPVKTMNVHDIKDLYQVDTGPVAFPDLARRYDRWAECLSLAFVAFNRPDFADFVVEDATPIVDHGREVTKVHHYSRLLSLPAANRLFAITR